MTNSMDICLGQAFDEPDLCETSSGESRKAVKRATKKELAEDARLVFIESDSSLDADIDRSHLVTGRRSDILEDFEISPTILGTGHYGCVRECLHKTTGGKYAVKTIDKSKAPRLDHIQREIELLCSIDHPSIMKMVVCYEDEDSVHIVTERYTGGELFDKIVDSTTACGCLPEDQAIGIIRSLLEAVQYLHSKDIVHRDIKPENVLFGSNEDGSPVKLIDFGLARTHGLNDVPMSNGVGTSYYMSPAVLLGKYDRSCDLWAVGTVAYILLCGDPPFNGCDDYEVQISVLTGDLIFNQAVWTSLSGASRDFVSKLLRMDSSRISTAAEALRHPWIARA